ncbi:MAG: hypothetical protein ABL878_00770 [Burkholderiales bacterium]
MFYAVIFAFSVIQQFFWVYAALVWVNGENLPSSPPFSRGEKGELHTLNFHFLDAPRNILFPDFPPRPLRPLR